MPIFSRRYQSFPDVSSVNSNPFPSGSQKGMPGLAGADDSANDRTKDWRDEWVHQTDSQIIERDAAHDPVSSESNVNNGKKHFGQKSDVISEKESGGFKKTSTTQKTRSKRKRKNRASFLKLGDVTGKNRWEPVDDQSYINEEIYSQASTIHTDSFSSEEHHRNVNGRSIKEVESSQSGRDAGIFTRLGKLLSVFSLCAKQTSRQSAEELKTPPCTPERDNARNDTFIPDPESEITNQIPNRKLEPEMPNQILGIEEYQKQSAETLRRERQELLNELCGFRNINMNVRSGLSQENALPVIHESFSIPMTEDGSMSSDEDNSTVCYDGVEI